MAIFEQKCTETAREAKFFEGVIFSTSNGGTSHGTEVLLATSKKTENLEFRQKSNKSELDG